MCRQVDEYEDDVNEITRYLQLPEKNGVSYRLEFVGMVNFYYLNGGYKRCILILKIGSIEF